MIKKNLPIILSIENSSSLCSICINNKKNVFYLERYNKNNNSQFLIEMLDFILYKSNLKYKNINTISFGCGPGSYTSLRILTSLLQGIALGWNIPIIEISSLDIIALETFLIFNTKTVFVSIKIGKNNICFGMYLFNKYKLENVLKQEKVNNVEVIILPKVPIIAAGNGCKNFTKYFLYTNKKLKMCNINYPKALYLNMITLYKFQSNKFLYPVNIIPVYFN